MKELKELYLPKSLLLRIYKMISKHPDYILYKCVKAYSKYNECKNNNNKVNAFIYGLKANRYASKYNLELYGSFGKRLRIWHVNIIINGNAKLGDNIQLHGNNCIGEKNGKAPIIGNNVDIGYGAAILGDIKIADNVIIGANSVVTKDFLDEGVVIAGCPAKVIKK